MIAPLRKFLTHWASRRFRIVFYAILTGVIAGGVNLLLPAEDLVVNMRALVRKQPAPQDIVVIGVDDKTLTAIGTKDVSRSEDADVVRRLAAAGVKRIYFDRNYRFKEDPPGDAKFVKALKENRGKVFLAVGGADTDTFDSHLSVLPNKPFSENANLVGIGSLYHPFGLMISVPLTWATTEGVVPSLSASLGDRKVQGRGTSWMERLSGLPDGFYRPDYGYDYRTIPTVSYIDVLEGKIDPATVAGRDVVIGGTSEVLKDNYELGFQGYVPGVYIHVIAAHTFKKDMLLKLGWIPAMFLVSIVIISGIGRGRSFDRYRIAGLFTVLMAGPLLLDSIGIEVEVMPALLTATIAIFRARALDNVEQAAEVNITSGLPSLQSLRTHTGSMTGSLVALKVRNYSAIVGSFDAPVEARLVNEIVRRIRLSDAEAVIYHEGDKLVWLTGLANPVDVFEHLEGLHRIVQNGIMIEGREVDLSFNCGVDTDDAAAVAKRLANALQAAEQAVRDDELVCLFDSASNEVQWEMSLLSELDRAIDNGEVWVAYQPKAVAQTGEIIGAEALARWTHPERGPISPEKFIRIAEEYHRIERITRFVLDQAVKTAKLLRAEQPEFTISVNISAQLLRNPVLPGIIFDVLSIHEMGPDCLILEITETDRLDRSSKTLEMMQHLVESGLEISIDDFGTGNATIDYLRLLPAVEVKVDKAFVSSMEENRNDRVLVQSIILMAHSLGRRTVAEGVENAEIKESLIQMGCDLVQGYYIGLPLRLEDLGEVVGPSKFKKTG